jgi:hypothetical protein
MELRSLDLDYVRHTVEELSDALERCPVLEVLRVHNCFFFNDEDEHSLGSKYWAISAWPILDFRNS